MADPILLNLTMWAECATVECIYRSVCAQMGRWLINAGISVIAIYIISGWMLWLWWNELYPHIDWETFYGRHPTLLKNSFTIPLGIFSISMLSLGDLRKHDRKLFWDMFVRDKASKLLLGYAVIILYFAFAK